MKKTFSLMVLFGALQAGFAFDSAPVIAPGMNLEQRFDSGQKEIGAGGAAYFSPVIASGGRPTVNYAGGFFQAGRMLTGVKRSGPWPWNLEGLIEAFGNGVFKGGGNYFAGATLILRYNIIPDGWKLTPFVEVGAGPSLTDFDRKVFGGPFEFNLEATGGARYFFDPHWSLNAGYRFQHVSNANIYKRNLGINAQGAVLSVSRYF